MLFSSSNIYCNLSFLNGFITFTNESLLSNLTFSISAVVIIIPLNDLLLPFIIKVSFLFKEVGLLFVNINTLFLSNVLKFNVSPLIYKSHLPIFIDIFCVLFSLPL